MKPAHGHPREKEHAPVEYDSQLHFQYAQVESFYVHLNDQVRPLQDLTRLANKLLSKKKTRDELYKKTNREWYT